MSGNCSHLQTLTSAPSLSESRLQPRTEYVIAFGSSEQKYNIMWKYRVENKFTDVMMMCVGGCLPCHSNIILERSLVLAHMINKATGLIILHNTVVQEANYLLQIIYNRTFAFHRAYLRGVLELLDQYDIRHPPFLFSDEPKVDVSLLQSPAVLRIIHQISNSSRDNSLKSLAVKQDGHEIPVEVPNFLRLPLPLSERRNKALQNFREEVCLRDGNSARQTTSRKSYVQTYSASVQKDSLKGCFDCTSNECREGRTNKSDRLNPTNSQNLENSTSLKLQDLFFSKNSSILSLDAWRRQTISKTANNPDCNTRNSQSSFPSFFSSCGNDMRGNFENGKSSSYPPRNGITTVSPRKLKPIYSTLPYNKTSHEETSVRLPKPDIIVNCSLQEHAFKKYVREPDSENPDTNHMKLIIDGLLSDLEIQTSPIGVKYLECDELDDTTSRAQAGKVISNPWKVNPKPEFMRLKQTASLVMKIRKEVVPSTKVDAKDSCDEESDYDNGEKFKDSDYPVQSPTVGDYFSKRWLYPGGKMTSKYDGLLSASVQNILGNISFTKDPEIDIACEEDEEVEKIMRNFISGDTAWQHF